MPVRPMLEDIELQNVQKIEVDGDQVLVQHGVPALEGDFLQRMGRRGTQITITGVLTGPEAGDGLKNLRDKFRAAEPVSFVADIAAATRVDQVLIEEMGVRELAGKPERFEYTFTLREYIPPPPPEEEPDIETPEPPAEEIDENVGTLIVEVVVEGEPDFDFSTVTVIVEGEEEGGTPLSRTLTDRTESIWTEEEFPPGDYTVRAVVTDQQPMSGSESATVRAGQTEQVTITLRPGQIIAKAFMIHFWFDKAFIEPCMRAVMRQVAEYAGAHTDEKLVIVGHTDESGHDDYNQSLSERRARSAYAYLTFGREQTAAVDEWNELRRQRPTGVRQTVRDTWGPRQYQYMLQDLGYYPGDINGVHNSGDMTDNAVRAFQADHADEGLVVDGDVGDQTWPVLIRSYLAQDTLAVPESQFLPNVKDGCDEGILKWLGCGEKMPVQSTPRGSCSDPAWRPDRRTEFLFVQANTLPCEVPQPYTFDFPSPGAVGTGWCFGPGNPRNRCCFITRDPNDTNKWLIQPVDSQTITVRGSIRFDDGTPLANTRYVLIAPDGEFMDGERICRRPDKGTPISGRTDANGEFSYPDKPKPIGVYTLEIDGPYVAHLEGQPLNSARGNVVCKRLDGTSDFIVIVTDRTVVMVRPGIILTTSIVVVKKSFTNPARQPVTLRTDSPFTGSGILTRSNDNIRFFTAATGGTEITFDGVDNVFTDAQLTSEHTIFAEGTRPSTTLDDIQITLTLTVNGQRGLSATATMTSVELMLDIFLSRTAPGVDPAPLPQPPATPPPAGTTATDKWYGGRFVHVQDPENHHGRALLIVRQVQPAAFAGDLVLRHVSIVGNNVTGLDDKVHVFENETLTPGDPAKGNPFEFSTSTVPAAGRRLWVEGSNVSGTLRDTGFQLGIKDLEDDGDRVMMTVVQFTQIQATIRSTPPNTVRAGFPLPTDHIFSSNSFSEDFAVNDPLVLMRPAQPDIQLEVTTAPAGLTIQWQALRNPDDHASLGGAADTPTITPDAANSLRAELDANQRGSFRIRAFIDINSSGTYEDREPSIPLNLILADATVVADNSVGNNEVLSATISPAGVRIRNGAWSALPLTAANLGAAGMAMDLIADVTGGGSDGRLGLDRIFAGLVNNLRDVDISAQYVDSTSSPPRTHHISNAYCSNGAFASGNFRGRPLFQSGDPAPALFAFPILDTGRGRAGLGGETATMGSSGPHTSVNRPVGQRWTIRCIDSPSRGFALRHPANANAVLRSIQYRHRFTAHFCFWSNITARRGATGDPADRVYSLLHIVQWEVTGDWNVTTSPLVLTATTPYRIRVPSRTTLNPIARAQDNDVEVRPPSGIGFLPSGVRVLCFDGSRIT